MQGKGTGPFFFFSAHIFRNEIVSLSPACRQAGSQWQNVRDPRKNSLKILEIIGTEENRLEIASFHSQWQIIEILKRVQNDNYSQWQIKNFQQKSHSDRRKSLWDNATATNKLIYINRYRWATTGLPAGRQGVPLGAELCSAATWWGFFYCNFLRFFV